MANSASYDQYKYMRQAIVLPRSGLGEGYLLISDSSHPSPLIDLTFFAFHLENMIGREVKLTREIC